jgi:hypothetical protein
VGTIQEIVFEENKGPPSLPIAIMVEFDNYSGPAILTKDDKRLVSVSHSTWEGKRSLLLLASNSLFVSWAITVHKIKLRPNTGKGRDRSWKKGIRCWSLICGNIPGPYSRKYSFQSIFF